MTRELNDVLKIILNMPQDQRAFLAGKLIDSLEVKTDVDVELAWQEEIQKRIENAGKGQADFMTWEDAKSKLQDN